MSYPNKTVLSTAITNNSNLDLSGQHATTANFMEYSCAKYLELVPRQSIHVGHKMFTRLDSMPAPTFGNVDIHCKAYFVPFRTIFPFWNEFITQSPYTDQSGQTGIVSSLHTIKNSELVALLRRNSTEVNEGVAYDYQIQESDDINDFTNYVFTPRGRRIYKILLQLGYRVDFNLNNTEYYHPAQMLLSFMKIYFDWYYPSAYSDTSRALQLKRWFDYYTHNGAPFHDVFVAQELEEVFDVIDLVCYDSDYITSAWDNPVASNDYNEDSSISIVDITANGNITQNNSGTPELSGDISQFGINALRALSDFMKRNQIVGSRPLDRYLAHFGITLSSEKLKRSLYLGGDNSKTMFTDVFSTADTDGAPLGSYAGRGAGESYNEYEFVTDEFGMFMIISTIIPKTAYYQGQDRITMHVTPMDFYTPEFDNLGVQAVSTREVFVPTTDISSYYGPSGGSIAEADLSEMVFGFVPRYAEYKKGVSNMTGDFVLGSKNLGLDAWNTFRNLDGHFKNRNINNVKHSVNFVLGTDSNQYNRLFYVADNSVDHFKVIHNFVIKSNFPGKPLFDTYEFENEDKAEKVIADINGVKAN